MASLKDMSDILLFMPRISWCVRSQMKTKRHAEPTISWAHTKKSQMIGSFKNIKFQLLLIALLTHSATVTVRLA